MKIAVVVRQVPDLIEPLEVADSGSNLNLEGATFIVNESDEHALEQALLLKEAVGGSVAVVALDFGEVDNTLYAAAAKGADKIVKVPWSEEAPPETQAAAKMYAAAIQKLQPDLVLVGVNAHDELAGVLAPFVAAVLGLPYVGVIRGVKAESEPLTILVCKEFPGAVMSRMKVKLPAVLGILGAEQPPRYVPVARIRAAMKSTQFEEVETSAPAVEARVKVKRLHAPDAGKRAEILSGEPAAIAARIANILAEKGLLK
jgi:electron transfer flavoprotein beta subunit